MNILQKPYMIEKIIVGIIVMVMIAFGTVIVMGAAKTDAQRKEVRELCPKTELVIFGGEINAPRFVYDCTGIDLKRTKR